jgi:hypothetical protein
MKKSALLVMAMIALLGVLGWSVYAQRRSPGKAWEYREVINPTEAQLNALGGDGWEMVGFTVNESNSFIYLKRER